MARAARREPEGTKQDELREIELRRNLLRIDAPGCLYKFMMHVNPTYTCKWFHKVIADNCGRLLDGEIRRLMVLVPPQHGKSEIMSRNFPAWALGRNPDLKIVGTSYASDLARQFARSVQRIMDSDEYGAIFPDTWLNGGRGKPFVRNCLRNEDNFEVVGHRGFYKAVGVGGALTGTPADIAIIDDPVKDAREAFSPLMRNAVWEWYNSVLLTRLHNDSRQLFIMTRWHEDDLAGRLLRAEPGEWTVLTFPAICETEGDGGLSHRKAGEALWEARHGLVKLESARALSPRTFAALYQQSPVVIGGNIVKREWFRTCTVGEFKARRVRQPVHFYLDTAYNKRDNRTDNDPSGILAACRIGHDIYIVHAHRTWKEMPDLLRFLPEYINAHGGDNTSVLHVEPKANGISVIQMLRKDTGLNVRATPSPRDSKETRLHVASPTIECGRVILVEGTWNEDFLAEVCGFPAQPHDEFVDVLAYAIDDLGVGDIDWQKAARLNIF